MTAYMRGQCVKGGIFDDLPLQAVLKSAFACVSGKGRFEMADHTHTCWHNVTPSTTELLS